MKFHVEYGFLISHNKLLYNTFLEHSLHACLWLTLTRFKFHVIIEPRLFCLLALLITDNDTTETILLNSHYKAIAHSEWDASRWSHGTHKL